MLLICIIAYIISFVDYLAGRRHATYYFPNPVPSYFTKQQFQSQTTPTARPTEILKDELFRTALGRFGFH
jgi:hypothetical protein